MQFIQDKYQKFRAISLNIFWVKLLQVLIKNHLSIKRSSSINLIINISFLQFNLNIGIKIFAKLSVLK